MARKREPRRPVGGARGSAGQSVKDGSATDSPTPESAKRTAVAQGSAPLPPASQRRSTSLLDAIRADVRSHLKVRGWTCAVLDDLAGLNDGHSGHLLSIAATNSKNGRGGTWATWGLIYDALHAHGFTLKTEPLEPGATGVKIRMPRGPQGVLHWRSAAFFKAIGSRGGQRHREKPKEQRREIARRGGIARAERLSSERRAELAQHAARA